MPAKARDLSGPTDLELQVVMNCLPWVKGLELGSSTRTIGALGPEG